MEGLLTNLDNYLLIVLTVVGGLHVVATGLEMIAKVTPWKKDDAAVAKFKAGLEKAATFLRRVGLEPPKS